MQYYSATKMNEIVVMRMDLESVTQSEVSQKEKNKYPILTHTQIYMEARKMVQIYLFAGQDLEH